ncbi:MAG: tetratricopeptide repeat protein, partial [Cyanobium sp.]
MMVKKTPDVAAIPAACRLRWLLISALVLPPSLPAVAMQAAVNGPERSPGVLLAQAPAAAGQAITAEVQGWFDSAKAAAAKGDAPEALRLQKQVVAWLEAHPKAPEVFRAQALVNLGHFLSGVGQRQEALAPTEQAVAILRKVQADGPEEQRFLAIALTNLGIHYSELGRRQEALAATEEALK